jgi:hypothetical protein
MGIYKHALSMMKEIVFAYALPATKCDFPLKGLSYLAENGHIK